MITKNNKNCFNFMLAITKYEFFIDNIKQEVKKSYKNSTLSRILYSVSYEILTFLLVYLGHLDLMKQCYYKCIQYNLRCCYV